MEVPCSREKMKETLEVIARQMRADGVLDACEAIQDILILHYRYLNRIEAQKGANMD